MKFLHTIKRKAIYQMPRTVKIFLLVFFFPSINVPNFDQKESKKTTNMYVKLTFSTLIW